MIDCPARFRDGSEMRWRPADGRFVIVDAAFRMNSIPLSSSWGRIIGGHRQERKMPRKAALATQPSDSESFHCGGLENGASGSLGRLTTGNEMASPGSANERLAELLSASELFAGLDVDDRAACAARFREVRFAKGEMLFARGDPGTHLYIVSEGQVRLAITTGDGRELSFQIVAPGDLFGEISVLDGHTRSAEATALLPTVLYSLERSEFARLRSANPKITDAVIAFLCTRLRNVSDKLESIALYPLEVRLARFLLAALRGRPSSPGRRLPLDIQYSQSELALLLGASRPKINLALGALESAGAIGRTSDRLFCDSSKLATIAQIDEPAK
jgi:CRP-like cAMP-binding protein